MVKQSTRWSMEDIRTIKRFIENAISNGGTKADGIKDAVAHFGVTKSAVACRLWKYEKGLNIQSLKEKNSKKIPLKRKEAERGPYKKNALRAIQNQAKEEVQDFLHAKAQTKELRQMVIDLMNTSGHIKAVSVDLSNKSFTVIY